MAREKKDQGLRQLWIGIDPGERWCGYALLRHDGRWRAQTGVLDASQRSYVELIDTLLYDTYRSVVVVESYQQRPVGHQAFKTAVTPQIIGSLRYATEKRDAKFYTVAPGDPDKELKYLQFGKFIEMWKAFWPAPRHTNWQHARSAWRVLGRWLLSNDFSTARAIIEAPLLHPSKTEIHMAFDLTAPTVTWRFHANQKAREDAQAELPNLTVQPADRLSVEDGGAADRAGRSAREGRR